MLLFVFEFLGTTELLVILVLALVLFGPRKLPELGRTLGKSLAEFKRATDDFKRTWEREVELDKLEREMRVEREAIMGQTQLEQSVVVVPPPLVTDVGLAEATQADAGAPAEEQTIARRTLSQPAGETTSEGSRTP